jgi:ribosomal protein S18 acetylase RimI-like enzyme
MEEITIRTFKAQDKEEVRTIAWQTAFVGSPGSSYFSDPEIMSDFLTRYFIDIEPQSAFVAEAENKVVGYLMGACSADAMNRAIQARIAPGLFLKALARGVFFRKKNLIFLGKIFMSFLKGEFRTPDIFKEYPAVLHINIKEGFRHLGIGARLIDAYLSYLRQKKVAGVCLATMSEDARLFFEKNGFFLIHQGRRSYFKYLLKRDLSIYIFAKKLV